jgi:hypothetical protein
MRGLEDAAFDHMSDPMTVIPDSLYGYNNSMVVFWIDNTKTVLLLAINLQVTFRMALGLSTTMEKRTNDALIERLDDCH